MNPRLSQDVEKLLSSSTDGAIQLDGADGTSYWLLTQEAMDIRQKVQEGIAEANRGESEVWDPEEIKRLGREANQDRSQA